MIAIEIVEVNSDGAPLAARLHDISLGNSVEFSRIIASSVQRGTCGDPECDSEFHVGDSAVPAEVRIHLN